MKKRLEFNFQSNDPWCPKFGAFSEPFPEKVRIRSKSPIFGADGSSATRHIFILFQREFIWSDKGGPSKNNLK